MLVRVRACCAWFGLLFVFVRVCFAWFGYLFVLARSCFACFVRFRRMVHHLTLLTNTWFRTITLCEFLWDFVTYFLYQWIMIDWGRRCTINVARWDHFSDLVGAFALLFIPLCRTSRTISACTSQAPSLQCLFELHFQRCSNKFCAFEGDYKHHQFRWGPCSFRICFCDMEGFCIGQFAVYLCFPMNGLLHLRMRTFSTLSDSSERFGMKIDFRGEQLLGSSLSLSVFRISILESCYCSVHQLAGIVLTLCHLFFSSLDLKGIQPQGEGHVCVTSVTVNLVGWLLNWIIRISSFPEVCSWRRPKIFDSTLGYPGEGPKGSNHKTWAPRRLFDSTLGYPGEGPGDVPNDPFQWQIASINVGSLERHPEIFEKGFDTVCLQETRHTDSNTKNLALKANSYGYCLQLGSSMKYLPNGSPVWGGVAVAATSGSSRPFLASDDSTSIWPSLESTARVTASWVAVTEQITVLVVSVYAFPCAQSDHGKVASNNNIFQMIFQMVSQFGRIPVIIGGDFQDVPHAYSTIADACRMGLWHDTSITSNSDGQWDRPITFSRQRKWDDPQNSASSSIDGLLVNEIAFHYLTESQVQPSCGLQHAFVVAKFRWPTHHQCRRKKGFKWVPHAAFDISNVYDVSQRQNVAQNLWSEKFQTLSENAEDAEQMMKIANQFAVETLIGCGATWKHGTRERGTFPKPVPARLEVIPSNHCDSSQRELNAISKTLCRIDDLSFKIARHNLDGLPLSIAKKVWSRIVVAATKHKIDDIPEWPNQDDLIRLWNIFAEIRDRQALQVRRQRVKDWRNRMATSAMNDRKDIYNFLKRKHVLPGHSAITNSEGMPIYHPADALEFARSQWNPIFQYHESHVPSRPLLDVVGNLLDVASKESCWEPITRLKLFEAMQSRKSSASGGIDGWRTSEMKILTQINFIPWAIMWNKIEEGVWNIPQSLQIARMVMIPKPGAKTQQPIDFRLIALLSIPYLLWSKVRFQDLTPWMLDVFPPEIYGGLKGKKTSDVAHHIAIRCEKAIATKKDIIGIKIDRSKCFDRIDVPIVATLAARLGMPQKFLNVWTQMYCGFRRFLCYAGFIDSCELGSNNGVAQGDAASVIAINILMSVWVMVLRSFPHIESFAFIDDGYIMCEREYIDELVAAFRATTLFDQLTGQVLNIQKSAMWGTSPSARKELKQKLPDIPVFEFFEVLGGQVASSAKNRTRDSANEFHLIRRILTDIAALPITFKQKAFLITSKVNSKLAYMPELRSWTKKAMDSFVQNAVSTLWGSRPGWRSTELLFGTLTDAIKVHPHMVFAAQTICNLISRCNNDPIFYRIWLELCQANNVISRGLLNAFIKAAGVVGIEFQPPCEIKFLAIRGSFTDFSPKVLRKVLSVAATQTLYNQAIRSSTRHDLSNEGSGVLDSQVAPPWVAPEPWRRMTGYDDAIIAGPMCGACPTADRLYRSALLSSPKCRWCGEPKEDIRHLTSACKGVCAKLGSPGKVFHDQPNLYSHGHFEVPRYIIDCWANATGPSSCQKEIFNFHPVTLFGDGSVYNADHFWTKTLGFAVVDMYGRTVASHGWLDPMGCSFKAELCAFRAAVQVINGPLHFVTDCKSIYNLWVNLSHNDDLPCNLAYREIWNDIFIQALDSDGQFRVTVSWAHQVDNSKFVDCPFQRNNKIADSVAKSKAKDAAPVSKSIVGAWKAHIMNHRVWLCRLSKLIQSMKISADEEVTHHEVHEQSEVCDNSHSAEETERQRFQNRFCKWDWDVPFGNYDAMMVQIHVPPPKKWQHSAERWQTTVSFFQQVRWRPCDDTCSAYELAFNFWFATRKAPPTIYKKSTGIFVLLVDWIRHVMRELKKLSISVFPEFVDFKPRAASWSSQYFPYGTFQGGRFYSSPECRLALARFVSNLPNGGKAP